jgi:formylglycine-generating enzyme required for sulfatase activity
VSLARAPLAAGLLAVVTACPREPAGVEPPSPPPAASAEEQPRIAMVRIPAGSFTQGSPGSEAGRVAELEEPHRVTLTRDVLLGVTEITQEQFAATMGYQPSRFSDCGGSCPVESVSWNEAAALANAVSAAEGLPACYRCTGEGPEVRCKLPWGTRAPYDCRGYRLPTEAEWEYAARAGSQAAFTTGGNLRPADIQRCDGPVVLDDGSAMADFAWTCNSTGNDRPRPVGRLQPNAWGLYDVHGNVWEWCHDGIVMHGDEPVTDPPGDKGMDHKVFRGGGWTDHPRASRAANRRADPTTTRYDYLGVRLARTAP